jgi:hypothetical protein
MSPERGFVAVLPRPTGCSTEIQHAAISRYLFAREVQGPVIGKSHRIGTRKRQHTTIRRDP